MMWNVVSTLPPAWSTAVTALNDPEAVTITVSVIPALAAGTPVSDMLANTLEMTGIAVNKRIQRPDRRRRQSGLIPGELA